jgi:hypothetical protein
MRFVVGLLAGAAVGAAASKFLRSERRPPTAAAIPAVTTVPAGPASSAAAPVAAEPVAAAPVAAGPVAVDVSAAPADPA